MSPMVPALIFAGSALACGLAFLMSYAMEEGLTLPLPSINWAAFRSPATAQARPRGPVFPSIPVRPTVPVFCEASGRFRDPVTRRFVKSPR